MLCGSKESKVCGAEAGSVYQLVVKSADSLTYSAKGSRGFWPPPLSHQAQVGGC